MRVSRLAIPDVALIEPQLFVDARGSFFESFNRREYEVALGRSIEFVQDNQSYSTRGVLRGLHYQARRAQAKLIWVVMGEVFDVAVDLRRGSATLGKWVGEILSAANKKQMWIPEGFAHGFVILSDAAEVLYKTTDYWVPEHERCIAWDDPQIGVDWRLDGMAPILSAKDQRGTAFATAEMFD